ncbi:PAS domain-containing protein [Cereibacter sphaeroides f. sp. denitrificans]
MQHPVEEIAALHADAFPGCGTYVWHVSQNRVVWSDALRRLYGLTDAPAAEEGFVALVHPDDRTRVEAETSAFLDSGSSYQHEFRIVLPDGTIRHIHDRGTIERHRDGRARALRGLNIDITEQRRARSPEDAMRHEALQGTGVYAHDVASGRSWWSEGMFRLLDVPPSDTVVPDLVVRDRVHPEDRERLRALQALTGRRPGPYDIEYRLRLGDGRIRWVRDSGEALGPVDPETGRVRQQRGTVTDITDSKHGNPPSTAGAEALRQVLDTAPLAICVADADLRVIEASREAALVLSRGEPLVGRDLAGILRDLLPEADAREAVEWCRDTLAAGGGAAAVRHETAAPDARPRVLECVAARIALADGRPGLACHVRDITDQVRQEEALREGRERLRLAHDAADMGAWDLDIVTGEAVWTPKLYALLGADPALPATAELFFRHVHPEDEANLRESLQQCIQTGTQFDESFRILRADGTLRHLVGRGRTVKEEDGRPVRMLGVNYDVTDRRRMERQIRDSARELQLVLDNAAAFIGVLDPTGTLVEANAPALDAGGLTRESAIGRPFWETRWWTHDPSVAERLRHAIAAARAGETVRYDAVVRMRGDTRMTIDFMVAPIFDAEGQVRRMVVSGYDVTDREQALTHVEFLMKEMNHRSKNVLALVQAIARQIWRADREDFITRFEQRLRALAASQDLLLNGGGDGAQIEEVARSQLAHFGEFLGRRIHLAGPPLKLSAEAAQALGMAFHELGTNAGKYGALSVPAGEVRVSWTAQNGALGVVWEERGGPPVAPPARRGFGSVVLDTLVTGTLSGEVEIGFAPEGLRWTLTCPVDCVIP